MKINSYIFTLIYLILYITGIIMLYYFIVKKLINYIKRKQIKSNCICLKNKNDYFYLSELIFALNCIIIVPIKEYFWSLNVPIAVAFSIIALIDINTKNYLYQDIVFTSHLKIISAKSITYMECDSYLILFKKNRELYKLKIPENEKEKITDFMKKYYKEKIPDDIEK